MLLLFFAGEMVRDALGPRLQRFARAKYPIFAIGLVLLGVWATLMARDAEQNIAIIFSNPVSIALFVIMMPLTVYGVVRVKTRKGRLGTI